MNLIDAFTPSMTEEQKQHLLQMSQPKPSMARRIDDTLFGVNTALEAGASGKQTPWPGYNAPVSPPTSLDYPKGRATAFTPNKVIQNPTEAPRAATRQMAAPKSAPQQEHSYEEFISNMTPEDDAFIQKETAETQQEITQAGEDPSIFKQFTDKLGLPEDAASSAWEGAKSAAGRIDWLTMAIVAAASASTGSNATKAIANGLMRGMESKTAQKQQEASNLLSQQNAANQSNLDWFKADTGRMGAQNTQANNAERNRLYAARTAATGKGGSLLNPTVSKWTMPEVDTQVNEFIEGADLGEEMVPWGRSDKEAAGIKSLIKNGVVQALQAGDTRDVSTIAREVLLEAKKQQGK